MRNHQVSCEGLRPEQWMGICSRTELKHVEPRQESQIHPAESPFPVPSQCHLPHKSRAMSCAACPFGRSPVAPWGSREPRCCRWEAQCLHFVTAVSHRSVWMLCTISDLGFMFTAFSRAQTQQSPLGNGCGLARLSLEGCLTYLL